VLKFDMLACTLGPRSYITRGRG